MSGMPYNIPGRTRDLELKTTYRTSKEFGAKGNGSSNDTVAMQDFFLSCEDGYIGPGTYRIIGGTLSAPFGTHIRGAGVGKTILQFESMGGFAGTDGISYTATGKYLTSSLSDLTIVIKGANGKYGITTPKGSSVFNNNLPRFIFERLIIKGDVEDGSLFGLFDYGWDRYIDLGDSRDSVIRDVTVLGTYDYTTDPATAEVSRTAFHMTGVQSEGGVLMPIVDHCYVHYTGKAVQYGYRVSNPMVVNSQFHRVYDGVLSPNATTSSTDYSVLEAQLHHLNINAQQRGVSFEKSSFVDMSAMRVTRASGGFNHANTWYGYYFDEVDELKIDGARAYNEGTAYTNTHVGLLVSTSDYAKIDNYHSKGAASGGITTGMLLEDLRFAKISGASFLNSTTAFRFETAASGTPEISIIGPQFGSNVTTRYSYESGVGKDNIIIVDDYDRYESSDNSATGITTAGTTTLTRGTDNQVKRFSFGAGAGAYTHNIDLSNTNAVNGDKFVLHIALTSTNPTVNVRDGSAATQVTLTTAAPTERYRVEMVFGSAWRCIGSTLSTA